MSNNILIKCEYCDMNFSTQYNLKVHKKTAQYCLRLRNVDVSLLESNQKCKYCGCNLSQKSSLTRHMASCIKYKDFMIGELEDENESFREIIETQQFELETCKKDISKYDMEHEILHAKIVKLEKINKEYVNCIGEQKSKILRLEKTIERGKGMITVYKENSKKPNIVNYNTTTKQKLSLIPTTNIKPLTIEMIDEHLPTYTKDMYKDTETGVVKFIKGITELDVDGTIERNYACTDRSRNTFYRLMESKEWKYDGGAKFINDVLDKLAEPGSDYFDEINIEARASDYQDKSFSDLMCFQLGLNKAGTKQRDAVLTKVKTKIKEFASV